MLVSVKKPWSRLLSILIPKWFDTKDTPCWTSSSNGTFSVKAKYQFLANHSPPHFNWKWIWALRIPAKLKSFLRLLMHGKILTTQQHCIHNLPDSDLCPHCNLEREDLKHLFFDCPLSANIWLQLPTIQGPLTASMEEWKEWLHTKVNHSRTISGGYFLSVGLIEIEKSSMMSFLVHLIFALLVLNLPMKLWRVLHLLLVLNLDKLDWLHGIFQVRESWS